MSFKDTLDKILEKHDKLTAMLSSELSGEEFSKLSKEYSDLEEVVEHIKRYHTGLKEQRDLESMLQDKDLESDMKNMVESELIAINAKIPALERNIKLALLPKDAADQKNAIIEIRAGTGGEEAALFANALFTMYQRYAEKRKWKFEVLSINETGIGGFKEASAIITGTGVFSRLKFESGVHRVQRVPETESSGRIHTSAATVAVLPEAEDVDVVIDEKDLTIDTYRASGAGGQHVNTTDSAVRITHIPTGIVVTQQDERSQHKNKSKALKILRSKIYELEREKQQSEIASSRRSQIGSGDRSERIRTYNFPQGRVTDHRINMTLYRIDAIIRSGDLDEFIDALIAQDEAEKLSSAAD